MRHFIKLLLLSLIAVSCVSNKPSSPFKEFEFYYNDTWSSVFSIKFTQTDTAYIKQYFVSNRYYKIDSSVKSNATYLGLFNVNKRVELNNLIRNINFIQYDSSYFDSSLKDGTMMKFFFTTDSLSKKIVVYGDDAPADLLKLGKQIAEIKRNMRLTQIDSVIPFFHKEIPPPDVDLKNFIPPSVSE